MTSVHLAGVALIALLSENFILVNCMGIGTHTKAFEDPVQARRTGLALTLGMRSEERRVGKECRL